jgi:hypothetical protein
MVKQFIQNSEKESPTALTPAPPAASMSPEDDDAGWGNYV